MYGFEQQKRCCCISVRLGNCWCRYSVRLGNGWCCNSLAKMAATEVARAEMKSHTTSCEAELDAIEREKLSGVPNAVLAAWTRSLWHFIATSVQAFPGFCGPRGCGTIWCTGFSVRCVCVASL